VSKRGRICRVPLRNSRPVYVCVSCYFSSQTDTRHKRQQRVCNYTFRNEQWSRKGRRGGVEANILARRERW